MYIKDVLPTHACHRYGKRNSFWQARKNMKLNLNLIFGDTTYVVYRNGITNNFM